MNTFKFVLSKEKFGKIEQGVDDTVYTAVLFPDNTYLVKWETEDGWDGAEYTKADVENNVEEGYWVKIQTMSKESLIEELKHSLPSHRILEVVNVGAVKVGHELILLKQRPYYEFDADNHILYNENHGWDYDYSELLGKCVLFDIGLFGMRGRKAIQSYLKGE